MAIKTYKNGKVEFREGNIWITAFPAKKKWPTIEVWLEDRKGNKNYQVFYTIHAEGSTDVGSRVIYVPLETEPYLPPTIEQTIEAAKTEYERYQMSKQGSLLTKHAADKLMNKVVDILKSMGIEAGVEYPGFIMVYRADGESLVFGMSPPYSSPHPQSPLTVVKGRENPKEIAAAIAKLVQQPTFQFKSSLLTKQADVPENLQEIRKPVSKEYDAIKWVYNWYVANELETLPWRILQKNFQQFTQKYNTLFTEIRHNKPDVTQADLKAWLDAADAAQEAGRYKVDYERYNDPKTSFRDVEQLVVQLNQSADAKRIIGQDPVFKEYIKMVSQGGGQSGHPVAETTVGWIRLDFINDEWLLVDEVQSDLVNSVTQAKSIVMEPSYESFFEHLTNPHVRELVQEKVTPEMFDGLKHHFNQKGYTPEKLDEIKDKLVELFQDWAEYGISSILEIARKHGIKNVAIHTAETIARRDESVEADKVKMYYDNLARSFGFRKQQLDVGDLKGNFWVRQAKLKSNLLNKFRFSSDDKKPKKMLVDKPEVYAEVRSDPRQVSLYGPKHEQELQDMYAKPSMKTVKSMLLKDCVEE